MLTMKKKTWTILASGLILSALVLQTGCGSEPAPAPVENTPAPEVVESTAPAESAAPAASEAPAVSEAPKSDQVADSSEMAPVEDVIDESLTPVTPDQLKDGTYDITVDSSSSMFKIPACQLTVADGKLTATMTMGGKGYLYIYMGTGEEAVAASEDEYIQFEEDAEGNHTYTVELDALNAPVNCAAFSKNKEKWYDRTLVFRADGLPLDAFQDGLVTDPASLNLEDGEYMVDVTLEGGSGRASVTSPTYLRVKDGKFTATIVWSSSHYDYMKLGETMYEPTTVDPASTFELPVTALDWKVAVIADTTAMGEPHEIAYTLTFDSASIVPAK